MSSFHINVLNRPPRYSQEQQEERKKQAKEKQAKDIDEVLERQRFFLDDTQQEWADDIEITIRKLIGEFCVMKCGHTKQGKVCERRLVDLEKGLWRCMSCEEVYDENNEKTSQWIKQVIQPTAQVIVKADDPDSDISVTISGKNQNIPLFCNQTADSIMDEEDEDHKKAFSFCEKKTFLVDLVFQKRRITVVNVKSLISS